jgi:AcrR family transcriptional regulator
MPEPPTRSGQVRKQPRQRRSREQVAKILGATRTLLKNGGIEAVTTVNIARKAGVSIGSFYQYFPNKKAVLIALYEDYLAGLLSAVGVFEDAEHLALGWREFFTQVFRLVKSEEKLDGDMRDLAKVIHLYPEMQTIDREQGQGGVDFTVRHLTRLGARGSRAQLERLAWFLYELNSGIWLYQTREEHTAMTLREIVDWEVTALLSVVATVFPDATATTKKGRR